MRTGSTRERVRNPIPPRVGAVTRTNAQWTAVTGRASPVECCPLFLLPVTAVFVFSGSTPRDSPMTLIAMSCRECGDLKNPDELVRNHRSRFGRNAICRLCSARIIREYRRTSEGKSAMTAENSARRTGELREPYNRYRNAHNNVRRAKGGVGFYTCCQEGCLESAAEWALSPWANSLVFDGPYRYATEPADYLPLCRVHHRHADGLLREILRQTVGGEDAFYPDARRV